MDYIFSKNLNVNYVRLNVNTPESHLVSAEEVLTVYRSNMFSKIVRIFRSVILIF